ncbi:hypothetical protein [Marinobacter salinus]|nr:hypothetical protein [Marinobacter salinus]
MKSPATQKLADEITENRKKIERLEKEKKEQWESLEKFNKWPKNLGHS